MISTLTELHKELCRLRDKAQMEFARPTATADQEALKIGESSAYAHAAELVAELICVVREARDAEGKAWKSAVGAKNKPLARQIDAERAAYSRILGEDDPPVKLSDGDQAFQNPSPREILQELIRRRDEYKNEPLCFTYQQYDEAAGILARIIAALDPPS